MTMFGYAAMVALTVCARLTSAAICFQNAEKYRE
jgi:hypothetical protein